MESTDREIERGWYISRGRSKHYIIIHEKQRLAKIRDFSDG